jgi:glycerophosphoryl diester phosphodiesterase
MVKDRTNTFRHNFFQRYQMLVPFLVFAHRGCKGSEPENTLRSFRRALELGAPGIELDAQRTADGIPAVIHDRRLERTTDGFGRVAELSMNDIRHFDAGKGETVPTLHEAVDLIAGKALLNIEIKSAGITETVIDIIRAAVARG